MTNPIQVAAGIAGSKAALARSLKVTKSAVSQWFLPGRAVPAKHVIEIEKITNGIVTRHDLRPDLYPPEVQKNDTQ